jgi:hypothetical protein
MDDDASGGWITFAAIILMFAGVMRFFDAIWAFGFNGALPRGLQDATLGENLNTYAWLYLLVGIVLVLAGIGVLMGGQFSRWIGVVGAALGGLSAMPWLPYYPVWSLIYIAIAALVMYALIAHGGRDASLTR